MAAPSLQLELPQFESLTAGTNLPHVPPEEIQTPPPPPPSAALSPVFAEPDKPKAPSFPPPASATNRDEASAVTPPQSPGRPTSMRRFLSRVSLNSSYNHAQDDKASVFSAPTSSTLSSPESTSNGSAKKSKKSLWKKAAPSSKRLSAVFGLEGTSTSSSGAPPGSNPRAHSRVQAIPPPPRLPDDMFGNGLASLDNDMFKNFK